LIALVGLALLVTGAVILACAPAPAPTSAPTPVPQTEANKELVRRYNEQVVNAGGYEVYDELVTSNFKRYLTATAPPLNLDAAKKRLSGSRAAFPDRTITIEDMMAEGDRVVYRSTIRATHQGTFLGLAPTGKQFTVTELAIIRFENGKFAEHWGGPDYLDMVQQFGGVVSAGPAK
jgi:predicted ester cyclase